MLTIGPLRLANNEVEAGVKTGPNIGCVRAESSQRRNESVSILMQTIRVGS